MSLLIRTRLQPGEQSGINLMNRFNGFPGLCKGTGWNGEKSETVETVGKEN